MDEISGIESGLISLIASVLRPETLAFFSTLGVWGWVAIAVILVLVGAGSYLLMSWVKKKANERAALKTQQESQKLEASLPKKQAILEHSVRSSWEKIKRWLEEKKTG